MLICNNSLNSNERVYTNIENLLLYYCFFIRINNFESSGGIIYLSNLNGEMNINECIFYLCSCVGEGGAIYCYNISTNFSSLIKKTCANSCFTTLSSKYGQSFQIIISSTLNNFNNLIEVSITKCSPNNLGGSYSFSLKNGNQLINKLNSSLNYCIFVSSIYIHNSNQFNLQFCTCNSNIVNNLVCIELSSINNNNNFSFTNIINNNSPGHGLIYNNGGINNIFNSNFYLNQNYLFYIYNGKLNILNNNINHNHNLITTGIIPIYINNSNIINLFKIQHLNTIYCFGEFKIKFKKIKKINFNFLLLILLN